MTAPATPYLPTASLGRGGRAIATAVPAERGAAAGDVGNALRPAGDGLSRSSPSTPSPGPSTSFFEYSVVDPPVYVGLDNYRDITGSDRFNTSLLNTFEYVAFTYIPV